MLLVGFAVDGHIVGHGLVRGAGHAGFHVGGPGDAAVCLFHRCQHPLGRRLIGAVGVDRQGRDVPGGQQIAPQGGLGGVPRLVLGVYPQLGQRLGGVAVGYDAHDFGVLGLLVGGVLDALARAHGLGDAVLGGADAVHRNLHLLTLGVGVKVVVIGLLFCDAVDAQVVQDNAAVVDVDLAQGFLYAVGGGGRGNGGGYHAHHHDQGKKQG